MRRSLSRLARVCILASLFHPAVHARAAPHSTGVTVSNGWFALHQGAPVIGFFTISNTGNDARLIVGWQTPACRTLNLQEAGGAGGNIKTMTVAAKNTLAFVRGGYHLMCSGPTAAMRVGASIPVTLVLQDNAAVTTTFTVRDANESQSLTRQMP